MRQNLKNLQEQQEKLMAQKNEIKEMELIVTNFAKFANGISSRLINLDWHGKKDIIRSVVKRIEMGNEEINIVYKINGLSQHENTSPQHCCNRMLRSEESPFKVTRGGYSPLRTAIEDLLPVRFFFLRAKFQKVQSVLKENIWFIALGYSNY